MYTKKVIGALILLFIFFTANAVYAYEIGGKWLLQGGGFAEKEFVRTELTVHGDLNIDTLLENGNTYARGYNLNVWLDATKLGINIWWYKGYLALTAPLKLPELDPTTNEPFELPPVTVDGITYKVTFVSTTSGTVKIYGILPDEGIEINSESAIWKEGTEKPNIPDKTSGCDTTGFSLGWTLLATLFLLQRRRRKRS